MRADLRHPILNRAVGCLWQQHDTALRSTADESGPSKEKIRAYMASRRKEHSPPPSPEEIRRRLGWNFDAAMGHDIADAAPANHGATGVSESSSETRANKPAAQGGFVQSRDSTIDPGSVRRTAASIWTWMSERFPGGRPGSQRSNSQQ